MGGSRESEKATRYIAQLDEARCNGSWSDVPELARKVEKHAPHRRCLTLTARSEVQIAAHSAQRPSTTASTSSTNLSTIIPALLTAVEEETTHAQDAFQATVCLAWVHFILDEPSLAIAKLPRDVSATASTLAGAGALTGWTQACIVKSAYLRGFSQEKTALIPGAINTYRSVLPYLSSINTLASTSAQFKIWAERVLGRLCILSDQSAQAEHRTSAEHALGHFRVWSRFWESTRSVTGSESSETARFRRFIWKAYYDTLSTILQQDLQYTSPPINPETNSSSTEKSTLRNLSESRLQQRAELKRVETLYESLLLKETHFPKANEYSEDVEVWVDAVMNNWRVLCGPTWTEGDLGEGGKGAVGRGVLDILYRAAMNTFHSTQILRHLFVVHASLAEFDLAFKAYDSYVEIVNRTKDRIEESGEEDPSLDDDNTILRTAAEAIGILCRFGSRAEAEKARDIGHNIEKWLKQNEPSDYRTTDKDSAKEHEEPTERKVSPKARATAYRAIGISQAHWARATFEADSRRGIQAQAIYHLRKALEPEFEDPYNIEALYALSLVLAETRDITGAIKVAKLALSPATKRDVSLSADGVISDETTSQSSEFARERKLIPVWHLLALLLTARSEYTTAMKSCDAAFEQFGEQSVFFGPEGEENAYRSDHLNQLTSDQSEKPHARSLPVVDRLGTYERSGIVQVKMTQLALFETLEGANAAVEASNELLALYARLFGDPAGQHTKLQAPATAKPPLKSSGGTIRNSIFRHRHAQNSVGNATPPRNASIASSRPSTVTTQATAAPTIQVTDEDSLRHSIGRRHSHKHGDRPTPKRSGSKLQKRSANSLRGRAEADAEVVGDAVADGSAAANGTPSRTAPRRASMSSRKSVETQERPLRPIAHNMPHDAEPPPSGHAKQVPRQDVRLPVPSPGSHSLIPDPRFSILQEHRHKTSLLIDIWLFISRLYTRAAMHEDAKGAVNEAMKLVEDLELDVAQESSTTKAFADQGWGGGKSVEELWGDVYAARGESYMAQSKPYDARSDFEKALLHLPDHAVAIVGISNVLLDIYSQVIPLEPQSTAGKSLPSMQPSVPAITSTNVEEKETRVLSHTPSSENQVSPLELNRLAARDRAYGLLSSLTKLGAGWDYSEAWFALARAYEEGGQMEKAKDVLWWCVELEDTQPIRNWQSVAVGGFVL